MDEAALEDWRHLPCAVLLRAYRDTASTNGDKAAREAGLPPGVALAQDARAFLESDGAAWLVAALDLDGVALTMPWESSPQPSGSN